MPRGGRERDRWIAKWWGQRITAGKKARIDYDTVAADVMGYFKADHGELYTNPEVREYFMDFRGAATVSVPKVAQMRNSLGPRLYVTKPVRTVNPMTQDGVMLGLSKALASYLNYTPRESKLVKHIRKAIDEALLRGRGILETVWDPKLEIITSKHLSSLDLVFDPDFDCIEDAEWIAIRRREPYWRVKRRIKEKWRLKGLKKRAGETDEEADHAKIEEIYGDQRGENGNVPETTRIIEVWTVLSRMGIGPRGIDFPSDRMKDNEDFVRLEIVVDHQYPLFEGEWEIPYYLDNDWPIATVDFVETLDSPWPQSIMGQVLSLQKGVDLLTSLRLTSCKNRDRVLIAGDAKMEREVQERIRGGSAAEYLSIELKSPADRISDKIFPIQLGTGSPESAPERQFMLDQMESTTGVTPMLTGGMDEGAKDRSATASQIKSDATGARVTDLKQKVEEVLTDAARHEAISIRLYLDEEDVSKFVKPDDINMFYVMIVLPGDVTVPVRDTRPEEERKDIDPENDDSPLTLEAISPQASNYFTDPAAAIEAAQKLWEEAQMSVDPRVIELVYLLSKEVDPMTQLPTALTVGMVDIERIWQDTAGMTPQELFRELSYEIASGSGQKINKEKEQANADHMIQTAMPIAMQSGDFNAVNNIMRIRDDAYDVPESQRVQFTPPPPPEPAPEQGGGDKGGDE